MKTFGLKNKGQVLLFVFILLILTSILVIGIGSMWESGLQTYRSQLDSLVAFYMAQAGMEHATEDFIILGEANYDTYPGTSGSLGIGNYTVTIGLPHGGPKHRTVSSIGRCGNAERRISFDIPEKIPGGHAWGYWRKFDESWTEE
jgi:hypothetical protein